LLLCGWGVVGGVPSASMIERSVVDVVELVVLFSIKVGLFEFLVLWSLWLG
jgi:hypothetical protein